MARACASKKTVSESNNTNVTTKATSTAKKTTARKTTSTARAATKTTAASKATTTKQRATKSSSKQASTKTKASTRACTTSKKTTTKAKASPVVPPTPVVEEKPKRVRKTKATKSVENINITTNNTTDLVWVNPSTGLTSTAHYDPTKQIVECKLSISDGKTDNPVTASFSLGVVKQLLQANYNIAVFVLQKSIYSFDFKRVDFEKFLRDNKIKLDLPKLAWV